MTRCFAALAIVVLGLSGCATIATGVCDAVSDTIYCHNKCPGASPEAEKKCFTDCMQKLACERSQRDAQRREAENKTKEWEWNKKNEERFRILEHRHPLQSRK